MKNKEFFNKYIEIFLDQNSMVNLISKNDEKFLWEKHICDSLAIEKFFEKYHEYKFFKMLDIGTGGGFPSIPVAICYPKLQVYAIDSIRKKINAIENIKSKLNLDNLHPICDRVENLSGKFDIITSRAVAPLKKITEYALPLLDKSGFFIAYKSLKAKEEIAEAKTVLKKYNAQIADIIEYNLPLTENYTRNMIVISFR